MNRLSIVLSTVIAIKVIGTVSNILNDEMYKQVYDWSEFKNPFLVSVSMILVAELLQAIMCVLHMRGYISRH